MRPQLWPAMLRMVSCICKLSTANNRQQSERNSQYTHATYINNFIYIYNIGLTFHTFHTHTHVHTCRSFPFPVLCTCFLFFINFHLCPNKICILIVSINVFCYYHIFLHVLSLVRQSER